MWPEFRTNTYSLFSSTILPHMNNSNNLFIQSFLFGFFQFLQLVRIENLNFHKVHQISFFFVFLLTFSSKIIRFSIDDFCNFMHNFVSLEDLFVFKRKCCLELFQFNFVGQTKKFIFPLAFQIEEILFFIVYFDCFSISISNVCFKKSFFVHIFLFSCGCSSLLFIFCFTLTINKFHRMRAR